MSKAASFSMGLACFGDGSDLQSSTYASTSTGLDPTSWPSVVAKDSTNVDDVSHWFVGAYIEAAPQALSEAKQLVESQLKQIMYRTYCYQDQDGPSLKLEDVFLASFSQYTDNFVKVGKILFGPAFNRDAKVSFVPKHQQHYPTGWGECPLGSVSQPHSGVNTVIANGSNLGNNVFELPKDLLPQNIPITGSDHKTYKNYITWLRSLTVVWHHKLTASVSPPILMPYEGFKVAMLRRTLGALLDDAVRDSHRLHPGKRVQALREMIYGSKERGIVGVLNLPVKTRVTDFLDVIAFISPEDGSIAWMKYGDITYSAITVGKHCLTHGSKDYNYQAIADELKMLSTKPGSSTIQPGVCVMGDSAVSPIGHISPNLGGLIHTGLTNFRRSDALRNEGQLSDYVPQPILHTNLNVPTPTVPKTIAANCNSIYSTVGTGASNCKLSVRNLVEHNFIGGDVTNVQIFTALKFDWTLNGKTHEALFSPSDIGESVLYARAENRYCPDNIVIENTPLIQEKGVNPLETSVMYRTERLRS